MTVGLLITGTNCVGAAAAVSIPAEATSFFAAAAAFASALCNVIIVFVTFVVVDDGIVAIVAGIGIAVAVARAVLVVAAESEAADRKADFVASTNELCFSSGGRKEPWSFGLFPSCAFCICASLGAFSFSAGLWATQAGSLWKKGGWDPCCC